MTTTPATAGTPGPADAARGGAGRIAVLHGGPSTEHDISVITARGVLRSLRGAGYTAESVWIDHEGGWHLQGPEADAGASAGGATSGALAVGDALTRLVAMELDCAFLAFHGTFGEDGRVQGALELAGVPYTGSRVTATALGMDKPLARRVLASAGVRVPEAIELATAPLGRAADRAAAVARLGAELGWPVVVKVPEGGSSIGVEIPRDAEQLDDCLARLHTAAPVLLCERFVAGVELTAGVLAREDGSLEALPIVEIVPRGEGFFDYEAKYDASLTDEIVPARISPEAEAACRQIGLAAFRVIGCRAYARTDLILDADGGIWALEINTLPGLTPESLLPKAAAAAGCDYQQLLDRVIAASR